jgi:Alkylmercury lyase/Bacterial regulatory proteins, gntR family
MDITIVHVADCPHVGLAAERVGAALDELGLDATVHRLLVTSDDDAAAAGLRGSPTILIDGRDAFPDAALPGLSCRLYRTDAGIEGAPSARDLVDVLRRERRRSPLEPSVSDDLAPRLRWAAFERLRTGHAITTSELAAQLGASDTRIAAALDELTRAGLIERDATGDVVGAHGLTLTPARHHLVLDHIALHTWCALDAVGIPAALGVDAETSTQCGWCDRPITLTMIAGTPEPAPDLVLWLPREPCTNVREQFCPDANLFCNHDHLDRWRAGAGRPEGDVLTVAEAVALGRHWWRQDRSDCCG